MKCFVFMAILSILAVPAYADTWLCVAEHIAYITDQNGMVTNSVSGKNDSKYLVDKRGVRAMGDDVAFLKDCIWNNTRPASCERSGDLYAGHFRLNDKNVFTLIFISMGENGESHDTIIKGKCSKISD